MIKKTTRTVIGSPIPLGTSGSVLFIDADGKLAQDNAAFFWDGLNNRLGIGRTPTASQLEIGDATNYSEFEADGTLKMNGAATVFNDINLSANALGTGASSPSKAAIASTTIRTYAFNGTATADELHGSFEIPHSYKEGSNLSFHVHWMPTTAGAGDVKWQLEYFWINEGGTASTSDTVSITTTAGGTAWVEKISTFADISGASKTSQGRFAFRIFRDPSDVADTYGDSAALLDVGVHFEEDTIGSRTVNAK